MTDIPPEILDKILRALGDDKKSLNICCQASQLLLSLAEPHIYRNINLFTGTHGKPFILLDILDKRPLVAAYIKSIHVFITHVDEVYTQVTSEWHDLPDFPNLVELSLGTKQYPYIPWAEVEAGFGAIWRKMLKQPALSTMTIKGGIQGFPLAELDHCLSLVRLQVLDSNGAKYSDTAPDSYPSYSIGTHTSHIQHLSIRKADSLAIGNWFLRSQTILDKAEVSHLRSLTFESWEIKDFEILKKILQACSSTLEELTVDVGHFSYIYHPHGHGISRSTQRRADQTLSNFVPLSELHRLSKLTMYSHLYSSCSFYVVPEPDLSSFTERYISTCLKEIAELLSSCKHAAHALKDVTLVLTAAASAQADGAPSLSEVEFGVFDSLFLDTGSNISTMSQLHNQPLFAPIVISVRTPSISPHSLQYRDIKNVFQELGNNHSLQRLVKEGMVVVEPCDDDSEVLEVEIGDLEKHSERYEHCSVVRDSDFHKLLPYIRPVQVISCSWPAPPPL